MRYFPHPYHADENGLLAVGGDLSPERLLLAYQFGIFPWFDRWPICWYFTWPRCVVQPSQIHISKSMRRLLTKQAFEVSINKAFEEVMSNCARIKRQGQKSTWITGDMYNAYVRLHQMGYAHSVEVWKAGRLVGGLYGVALGKIFYGESMFALQSNASKYGFILLCKNLTKAGYELIDCQQKTEHMMSLGATMMDRDTFWSLLKKNAFEDQVDFETDFIRKWCCN